MVRAQVEMMNHHLVQHFQGFEELIKTLIADALTPEKLYIDIQEQIKQHLRYQIESEMSKLVTLAIRNCEQIQTKIKKAVKKVANQSNP